MAKLTKNSRQHKRIGTNFLIKYQIPEGTAGDSGQLTNLMDLSRGGLSFLTSEYLEKDAQINVSILIPTLDHPVQAEAKVIRTFKMHAKRRGLAVAVQFTRIAEEDQKALDKFLNKSTRGKKSPLFVDLPNWVIRRK